MPELPEVETARASLRPVLGKVIARVEVRTPAAVRTHPPAAFARLLAGRRIVSIERRGKALLFGLRGGWVLVFHFKLWGTIRHTAGEAAPDPQTAVRLVFRNGGQLEFRELQLSTLELYRTGELGSVPYLSSLGVEPLSAAFTRSALNAVLEGRGTVKSALTDQTRIAGIGNLWAHEILHAARIRPHRPARSLTPAERARVYRAIRTTLRRAVARGGEPEFVDARGRRGRYRLAVYGRAGRRCPRGDGVIRAGRLGGRPTFFCPKCQH